MSGISVNLGSGVDLKPGYLNIDMLDIVHESYLRWNLNNGFPHHLAGIEYIYSAHMLEHFRHEDGLNLLRQARERMKTDAKIRLCLPNFRTLAEAYLKKDWDFFLPEVQHFAPNGQMMEIVNYACYQYTNGVGEHLCQYDPEYAIFTLQSAGFRECKEVEFDPTIDSPLELRKRYSFYVEGIK